MRGERVPGSGCSVHGVGLRVQGAAKSLGCMV